MCDFQAEAGTVPTRTAKGQCNPLFVLSIHFRQLRCQVPRQYSLPIFPIIKDIFYHISCFFQEDLQRECDRVIISPAVFICGIAAASFVDPLCRFLNGICGYKIVIRLSCYHLHQK